MQHHDRSRDRVPPMLMVSSSSSSEPQNNVPSKSQNVQRSFLGSEPRKPKKNFYSTYSSLCSSFIRRREASKMKKNDSNSNGGSKYLKPGALAQLRDARMNFRAASSSSSCTAIGRKRVLVMDYGKGNANAGGNVNGTEAAAEMTSNDGKIYVPSPQKKMLLICKSPETPVTPKTTKPMTIFLKEEEAQDSEVESRLEALPFDLLLRILCLLHHDQLKTVFHVSQRLRKVALIARQCYFNYTTPDRARQEMLRLTTPRSDEHWPFLDGVGFMQCPVTPKAPRHDQRLPSRLSLAEMRQISASLFQGPSSRFYRRKPPGLPRPGSRALPSHRVLFYEDELCQAVAQNTLR